MNDKPTVTSRLDTRSTLKSGEHPVKLRLYYGGRKYTVSPTKQLSASKVDYAQATDTALASNLKIKQRQLRTDIQTEIRKGYEAVEGLRVFTFEAFKKAFKFGIIRKSNSTFLKDLYALKSDEFTSKNQFGSRTTYNTSLNALNEFALKKMRIKTDLALEHISVDFLNAFDLYQTEDKGNSVASAQAYLRPLQAVWNVAIDAELIDPKLYPFGKKKYQIGTTHARKTALTDDELRKFYNDKRFEKHPARLFFFFSYFGNGMNPTDICRLKMSEISTPKKGERFITFYRQKTKGKGVSKPILVKLTRDMLNVISLLQSEDRENPYVFDILKEGMSAEQQYKTIADWKRLLHRQLELIGIKLGHELNMSMARNCYANTMVDRGLSVENLSLLMGHKDIKTTQVYLRNLNYKDVAIASDKLESFKLGKGKDVWISPKLLGQLK